MFANILVPTDGSAGVENAVNCAIAIARKFHAKVHILHVVHPLCVLYYNQRNQPQRQLQKLIGALHQEGEWIVASTTEVFRAHDVEATGEVRDGYPAEVILAYAQEMGIELIVMGAHGRHTRGTRMLGHVANEVVHRASIPVITASYLPPAD